MTKLDYRYQQEERLKSRKQISLLFKNRRSVAIYPLRIFWTCVPNQEAILPKVAFTVSKKTFKSAVKRNKYKRIMREVYRLNKHELIQTLATKHIEAHFMLIFVGNEQYNFKQIEQAFLSIVDKFKKKK
jgi:ribonuclease P protein component